jgi:PAS domain-containing protein
MDEHLERLKDALISQPDVELIILTRDHDILWFNEAMAREFGVPLQEARGRKCYEVMSGIDEPHEGCWVPSAFETGTVEARVQTFDGKTYLFKRFLLTDEVGAEMVVELPGPEKEGS